MADNSNRKPRPNRSEQRLARMLKASEGIKYTEALNRVRAWMAANQEAKPETDNYGNLIDEIVEETNEDSS